MNHMENEVPKHQKKKESSISKAKSKSKHKHEYNNCLLIDKEGKPYRATYCKICGKIDDVIFFEAEPYGIAGYRMLNADEVCEKYNDLEWFYVESIWQKYIPIKN